MVKSKKSPIFQSSMSSVRTVRGHATYGNHYWKKQGAALIGHVDAQHEIDEKGFGGLARMREYAKEFAEDTELTNFDITFDDQYEINLGNLLVIAKEYGSAHSPGDVTVLIPAEKVVLAGDMAFHVRMPPIFDNTDTALWIESFDLFADEVADWTIVPGHGGPTDITDYNCRYQGLSRLPTWQG